MAEITIDELKQLVGGLYIDLVVAQRDLQKMRETSSQLLEATRPQADMAADNAESATEPLPPTAIRRKGG